KNAPGANDHVAANDHGPIMQRRVRGEDRCQQVGRHFRLHLRSRREIIALRNLPLERDDATDARAAQALHRARDLLGDLAHVHALEDAREGRLSQPRERGAQLRREDHERREQTVPEQDVQHVRDHGEAEDPGEGVYEREHANADEHLHGPCAMDQQQQPVDAIRDDRDLDRIAPAEVQEPELIENVHEAPLLRRMPHAASSARRFARTSCTRKIRAPSVSATTLAPTVPSTRSAGSRTPLNSPTTRLRDTPITSGYPSAASRSSAASTATDCSPRLEKPIPGSSAILSVATPCASAAAARAHNSVITSPATSLP